MAAQGAMVEAEAAFELASQIPVKGGLYLFEVLALRDLKVLVLDKDGRGVYMHAYLVDAAVWLRVTVAARVIVHRCRGIGAAKDGDPAADGIQHRRRGTARRVGNCAGRQDRLA